jgi:hypothetical protein
LGFRRIETLRANMATSLRLGLLRNKTSDGLT